ncbi:hypothetical protein BJ742DRAFT_775396 [Cladochytrium replicatum]|nr:hypothetical protein BJ742DRAFT_775396 [Cladochytrium replicatum]
MPDIATHGGSVGGNKPQPWFTKRRKGRLMRSIGRELKRRSVEKDRVEGTGSKGEMLKYRKGLWNTKILEHLEELDSKERESHRGQAEEYTEHAMGDLEGDRLVQLESEIPVPSNMVQLSPLVRIESLLDIASLQPKLERVWMMWKPPSDQRLSMAIKYGSQRFAPKLQKATDLWEMLAEHVVQREALMEKIEELYIRFRSNVEARIQEESSVIKHYFKETITHKGMSYLEKMKHDYTDLTFRLQSRRGGDERRRRCENSVEVWSASGLAVRSLTRAGTAETQGTTVSPSNERTDVRGARDFGGEDERVRWSDWSEHQWKPQSALE